MTALIEEVLSDHRGDNLNSMSLSELRVDNEKLSANMLRMSKKLAMDSLELTMLRRKIRRTYPDYDQMVIRAEIDAKGLYVIQCAGLVPSRRQALETLSIGQRPWERARKMAEFAGIHDGNVFLNVDTVTVLRELKKASAYAADNKNMWKTI
jgi:hypothetical protein